ncbi:MAG: ABC transporter permease [Acidobacteriota bacterium]
MKDLFQDLRFAWRGLRRRPGFTAIACLTLALGIGINVTVLSVIQALLLRPLPFPEADRLVRVMAYKGAEPGHLAQREIEDLQHDSKAFEEIAAYYHSQYNVTGDGPPEAAPCAINTHHLFSVLGARFALGGPFSADGDFIRQYRVVLTHDFWQRRFGGDPGIIDRSIVLDGGSYVVDGVLEAGSAFPPGVELYRQVTEYHGLDGRRHSVLARLKPDVSVAEAQQELARFGQLWQERHPELNRGVHFEAVPLRDSWVGTARPYLLMLAGAVAFVLLIAIVNTVNLLLARASERRGELTLRASLGAGRWRLARPLLMESLLLSALGGGVGLLLASAGLRFFSGVVQADLPRWMAFRLDPVVLVAAVVLVLLCGVLAAVAPALTSSRRALGQNLRSARGAAGATSGLRGALVTAEIALALMLLIGAGLMIRSVLALDRQDLGFDAENLFTVRVDPPYWTYNKIEQMTPFFDQAAVSLAEIPGVEAVAANRNLPLAGLDGHNQRVLTLESQSVQEQEGNPFAHLQSVGPGYFDAMGIPLHRGRAFTRDDRAETLPVAVLSQRLAQRLWPSGSAIGERLKLGPPESEAPWMEVVGIVGDVRSERLSGDVSLDLYISHYQHFTGDTYFAFRSTQPANELLRRVEAAIQGIDADLPLFDIAPMAERLAKIEWQRQATSRLFTVFGILALVLAAGGTYGVMAYSVTQRRHEMGIRQALGARPLDLLTAVFRQGAGFLLRGTVIGLVAGLALGRLIGSLLFGVAAADPLSLSAAWLALAVALVFACLLPALRAARLDPLTAIREDPG